jgi:hypothetical protein
MAVAAAESAPSYWKGIDDTPAIPKLLREIRALRITLWLPASSSAIFGLFF